MSTIVLMSRDPDRATFRFSVAVDGYLEQLSLGRIKEYVAAGYGLVEYADPPCEGNSCCVEAVDR